MKIFLKILVPILFLAAAYGAYKGIAKLKPAPKSKEQVIVVPLAEVVHVSAQDHQPPVLTYGTVQSYFETTVTPQVSGRIIEVAKDFRVGKLVKKDMLLARIDDTDYVAALARESANLATAKRTLAEEEIRAKQAAEDWIASGRALGTASDFVLRKPQLEAAKASIMSSEAAEKKAQADIQRTMIRAPYDAVVLQRTASLGNWAAQQQSLGLLVATDKAEVRLPLTANQVTRVNLPGLTENSPSAILVTLTSASKPDVTWQGTLTRTEPSVEARNQVTYIIVEVEKPYRADPAPLVVGTFVNASIPAKVITDSYQVPESALVNDSFIWILDENNKLVRLSVNRVYSHEGDVFLQIAGVKAAKTMSVKDLRVVTRPLTNFKQGEKVKPVMETVESSSK